MYDDLTKCEIAEIKVSYKTKVKASDRPHVDSSNTAKDLLIKSFDPDTIELFETSKAMYLNRSNKVIGVITISEGGLTGTIMDVRKILAPAINLMANGIILCHNHPSGNEKPSENDILITQKVKEAAKFFDITVLDHLIITPDLRYYSLADEGVI